MYFLLLSVVLSWRQTINVFIIIVNNIVTCSVQNNKQYTVSGFPLDNHVARISHRVGKIAKGGSEFQKRQSFHNKEKITSKMKYYFHLK
jgi:endonuclease III